MTRSQNSPRIADDVVARYQRAQPAAPHTAAELDTVMRLLRGVKAHSIAIGHGREPASIASARALADAWTCAGDPTRPPCVLRIVGWPANAASWLRPAQRLLATCPDAWVIADTPTGFAQLAPPPCRATRLVAGSYFRFRQPRRFQPRRAGRPRPVRSFGCHRGRQRLADRSARAHHHFDPADLISRSLVRSAFLGHHPAPQVGVVQRPADFATGTYRTRPFSTPVSCFSVSLPSFSKTTLPSGAASLATPLNSSSLV